MLGFAVIDAQDDRVAVWLVGRTEPQRAGSTNAVVADRADTDTVALLTSDRHVLLAPGVDIETPTPGSNLTPAIDRMAIAASELRDGCRRQWRTLRLPEAPFDKSADTSPSEQLVALPADAQELPRRAVAWADGLVKAWSFWLATESVRHRKVRALHAAGKGRDLDDALGAEAFALLPSELREIAGSLGA